MSPASSASVLSAAGSAGMVAINTATASDLARLHGIGAVLAERIVEFRGRNGPLRGPDDLAEVDGIGPERALALAPFINWIDPSADDHHERSLFSFCTSLVMIAGLGWWIAHEVPAMTAELSWIALWMNVSVSLTAVCCCGAILYSGLSDLTASKRVERRRMWVSIRWTIAVLVGGASSGLANLVYFCVVEEGWNALFRSPLRMAGLGIGIVGVIVLGSLTLVAFRPAYLRSRRLATAVNFCIPMLFPLVAVFVWSTRTEMPLLILLIYIAAGIVMLIIGILVLRGHSVFELTASTMIFPRSSDPNSLWLQWINSRLPDPEQQKALRDALQQAHPRSKWQTLAGVLIVGTGTWLLGATASAIWEWLVQNWLTQGFGKP